jgi:hypothetical protein
MLPFPDQNFSDQNFSDQNFQKFFAYKIDYPIEVRGLIVE